MNKYEKFAFITEEPVSVNYESDSDSKQTTVKPVKKPVDKPKPVKKPVDKPKPVKPPKDNHVKHPMWIWKVQHHTEYENYAMKCPYLPGTISILNFDEYGWSYICRRRSCRSSLFNLGVDPVDTPIEERITIFKNGKKHVKLVCGQCNNFLGWKNPRLFND